jgi:hypothetical protein
MFRAMTSEGHTSSKEDGLSDNEKIDRAIREAAAEAHKKKVKLRQAARFWKDPFSPDPDKPVAVRQHEESSPVEALSTRRELARALEETAVARADAAAARAEAARANAARARAEANAAYVTAVAAKKEAQAARASCDEARLAKAPSLGLRRERTRDTTTGLPDGLVTSNHHDKSPAAGHDKGARAAAPPAPAAVTAPAAPSPSTDQANAAASRAWRNGIVVVPLSPGR